MKHLKTLFLAAIFTFGTLFAPAGFPQTYPDIDQAPGTVAVDYDGSNDYLSLASDLSGNADGKTGFISLWFRVDGGDGAGRYITGNETHKFYFGLSSANDVQIVGLDAGGVTRLVLTSDSTYLAGSGWHHLAASWDLAAATGHLYVDGADDKAAGATLANADIDYTQPSWAVGALFNGGSKWSGGLSETYINLAEYLDISIPANLWKVRTVDGHPADLGPSGYKPTGTAPLVYMRGQFNAAGVNSGTGGDFAIVGSPTDTPGPARGPPPIYLENEQSPAVSSIGNFATTSDILLRGGDLTGLSDSKEGTISAWFRVDAGDGDSLYIIGNSTARFRLYKNTGNGLSVIGQNSLGKGRVIMGTETTTFPAGTMTWHHVMSSWDVGATTPVGQFYVDGVDRSEIAPTLIDSLIDYTAPNWAISSHPGGAQDFLGGLAEIYFTTEYLDLTEVANQRKFITADGEPVPLGLTGGGVTGTDPLIYMRTPFNNNGFNSGTGGHFTFTGTPLDTPGPGAPEVAVYPENEQTPGAVAVDYDGSSDSLTRASAPDGTADGKELLFSTWFRVDGGVSTTARDMIDVTQDRVLVVLTTADQIALRTEDSASTVVYAATTTATFTDTAWHHIVIAVDAAAGEDHIYIDGVSEAVTGETRNDANINYTATSWTIGDIASGGFGGKWNGGLAETYLADEYLDISIPANLWKLRTADGQPADLGPSGYKVTGTAPLVYMRGQFNAAGVNSGTGGDFVINGAPLDTPGPARGPPPIYPENEQAPGAVALDYGGATDYLTRGEDLTGNSDGQTGLFSCWFRKDGGDGAARGFTLNSTNRFYIIFTASNKLQIAGLNDSSSTIFSQFSITTYTTDVAWRHLLVSYDLGNDKAFIYVDDVSVGDTPATLTDDDIDYTGTDWSVGASTTGAFPFNGALSEFYFTQEYLDLSVMANRRKFITADGQPADLGLSGYRPTGTAPIVYMKGQSNEAGVNSGTGGVFTVNGAPTDTVGPAGINVAVYPENEQAPGTVAVDYDGASDYLLRGSALAGATANTKALFSAWVNQDVNQTNVLIDSDSDGFLVWIAINRRVYIWCERADQVQVAYLQSSLTTTIGEWTHIAFSVDTASGYSVYIDGVEDTAVTESAWIPDGLIDWERTANSVAAKVTTANKLAGELSELYATNEYLDLSVVANLRKFIDANGDPVPLGLSGYRPTGTAPLIYMRGQANAAGVNSGTGGDFAIVGAPLDVPGPAGFYSVGMGGQKGKGRIH